MLWITKYRHNKIVGQYEDAIKDLKEALYRKDTLVEVVDKLTDRTSDIAAQLDNYVTSCGLMESLDDSVPRYVEDYFGGKCIRQESTPVTILDANGKATYSQTGRKTAKGMKYILVKN